MSRGAIQAEYFDIDCFKPKNRLNGEWTHSNTINYLPENPHWDAGDTRFEPGNYLLSMRSLDTVMIVSRRTVEIVWKYSGDYRGGLSGQHEPNMVPNDRPGAGTMCIWPEKPWTLIGSPRLVQSHEYGLDDPGHIIRGKLYLLLIMLLQT